MTTATLVQSKNIYWPSSTNTISVELDSTPTQGNLLIAVGYYRSDFSYSDFSMSGWSEIYYRCFGVSGGSCGTVNSSHRRGMIAYAKIAGASESTTVTLNCSLLAYIGFLVVEISQDSGHAPVYIEDAGNDNAGTAGTSLATGTTGSLSGYGEYLLIGLHTGRNSSGTYIGSGAASWDTVSLSNLKYEGNTVFQSTNSANISAGVATSGGTKASTASWTESQLAITGIVAFGLGEAGAAASLVARPNISSFSHILVR